MFEKTKQIHRLSDFKIKEVSIVDRAANKKQFIVVKNEEPDAPELFLTKEDKEAALAFYQELYKAALDNYNIVSNMSAGEESSQEAIGEIRESARDLTAIVERLRLNEAAEAEPAAAEPAAKAEEPEEISPTEAEKDKNLDTDLEKALADITEDLRAMERETEDESLARYGAIIKEMKTEHNTLVDQYNELNTKYERLVAGALPSNAAPETSVTKSEKFVWPDDMNSLPKPGREEK